MAKLTTTDLTQLSSNETGAVTALNNNFAAVETAMENTLSRDGTTPNTMAADFDMNSNRILNLPAPVYPTDVVRLQDISSLTDAAYDAQFAIDKEVNPCDTQFGATGDGTTDDILEIQAALDYLAANGGGTMILNHNHAISGSLTYTSNNSLTIVSPNPKQGKLIYTGSSDIVMLDISRGNFGDTEPFRIYNVGFDRSGATDNVATALRVLNSSISTRRFQGDIIYGVYVNGTTSYFANGITLTRNPHSKVFGCWIHSGHGGLTTDKTGSGLEFNTWQNGSSVTLCVFRGWDKGISVTDSNVPVGEVFQSEGFHITLNHFAACDHGIHCNIANGDQEIAWNISNNAIDTKETGVYLQNLIRININDNRFFWNGRVGKHSDVYIVRGDTTTPVLKNARVYIADNFSSRSGNIIDTVTGITRGAGATTISFTSGTQSATITGITQADPAVVTYSGSDIFANDDYVTLSGIVGMTELNGGEYLIDNVDTGANTFELVAVDSTGLTAYVSGGTASISSTTGTLADGDVVIFHTVGGTVEIEDTPYVISNYNGGAGTFDITDYYTGAAVNSSAWTAFTSGGYINRYSNFVEVLSGQDVSITDNHLEFRSAGLHLGANTDRVMYYGNIRYESSARIPPLLEWINDSTGTENYLHVLDDFPFVNDGGAHGDGIGRDDKFLQKVLNRGEDLILDPNKTYLIYTSLLFTQDYQKIIGNGAEIIMAVSSFNNATSGAAARYGTNAVGIFNPSYNHCSVSGVRMHLDTWTEDRYVIGIASKTGTNFKVTHCELYNFSQCVGAINVNQSNGFEVSHNYIHDIHSNSSSGGQLTGIVIDADTTTNTIGGVITNNRIIDMYVGSTFYGATGYDVTGIHLSGAEDGTNRPTSNIVVCNNHIENTGEAIDVYGWSCTINDNVIREAYTFGIPLKHGASYNTIANNTLEKISISALRISGGDTSTDVDSIGNIFSGNVGYDIGFENTISSGTNKNMIYVGSGAFGNVVGTVFVNNIGYLNATYGKYGVSDASSAGSGNKLIDNKFFNYLTADYSITAANWEYIKKPGIPQYPYFLIQDSDYALTSSTSAQKMFSATGATAGAFTTEAGKRYRFRVNAYLTTKSASSGNVSFGFSGTTTATEIKFNAWGVSTAALTNSEYTVQNYGTAMASYVIVTETDTDTIQLLCAEGFITVNAAGTFIPTLQMSVASAMVCKQGSYIEIWEVPTDVYYGAWS